MPEVLSAGLLSASFILDWGTRKAAPYLTCTMAFSRMVVCGVRMAEPPFTPHKNLLFKGESRKTFDFEKAMDTHPNQVAGWRKLY
jgi:hypothetical protein